MDLDHLPVRSGVHDDTEGEVVRLRDESAQRLSLAPENDAEVREVLRLLGQPAVLPKETDEERRARVAVLVAANKNVIHKLQQFNPLLGSKSGTVQQPEKAEVSDDEEEEEEFYTPASDELVHSRRFLIRYSMERSRRRLRKCKADADNLDVNTEITRRRALNSSVSKLQLEASQVASTRPVSLVRISPNQSRFASASWDGGISVFDCESLESLASLPAHAGKVGGLDWNSEGSLLVTGADDNYVRLTRYNGESNGLVNVATLGGHENRVVNTVFHPSDKYVASASFDTTWRLWDVETAQELQLQEGHSKEVYSLSFQPDGALICSGGLDSLAMVWDLRSGKNIVTLQGHAKPVYCVDWSSNSHQLATGGGDGVVNVWDLRKLEQPATKLLAHKSIVSSLRFERNRGDVLVSGGYDRALNVYSSDNWNKICCLEGHTDKLLGVDVAGDCKYLVSSGWDRSVKLWKN
ncbi:U4/U6-U5 snRNP complex subunit PRP4 KNAG_0F03870 [Huiozyma naganishii CBS 8797]|uniref:Uncharacterized protein n=1 Tax=Huiozyma naganishii (strain ATCC MYA-139 / BCRC 22969 / CBS 8797 / KCTC 17520 / NBRC 10181 / NCYC 3082 / Yp74L-3) TaxID=1071383 RepID=J7S8R5_HUIN7|nr:hypothetical protein KNAG_0F03870 [Kazachstania naganishii CBS 8797]CCK71051.1 hypothetical protein KNAG_0F03870 [Kazachstania naganishii CBS 8797]